MQFSRPNLRFTFCCSAILVFAAIGLAACGNSCFAGVSNNGNGVVIIKAGNPPPSCPFSQGMGTMNVLAAKIQLCETCATTGHVEHVFVTVRGIQLRSDSTSNTDSSGWIELAPQFASEPRQIDLTGSSIPEILVMNAKVPAGNYRELRLQFSPGSPTSPEELPANDPCGAASANCIVMADGHVQPLLFAGDTPELLIPSQNGASNSFVILPDSTTDLQLTLMPHQIARSSDSEGWKLQSILVGHVTAVHQSSLDSQNDLPD
jgi:Domain of unknown function (DUF4382)